MKTDRHLSQEDNELDNDSEFVKRRVFTDDTFTLLRNTQWKIYNATGFTPDFSKLLEKMVTTDSCTHTAEQFIQQLG